MGSRAIAVIARDADAAAARFGVSDGSSGTVYTRTGRPFFPDTTALVDRIRGAIGPLFDSLDTDWIALDCELLPWSAKALPLIKEQYASVAAAAGQSLPEAIVLLGQAAARGLPVQDLRDQVMRRFANARAYRSAFAAYVEPTEGLDGLRLAPFQVLAVEGEVTALTRNHAWHLEQLALLTDSFIAPTRHRHVELASTPERDAATRWWLELTEPGGAAQLGEGMVVKPLDLPDGSAARAVQPGLKVRGREYLRIIYGPDYLDSLDVLRRRHLGKKRSLASREHGLGLDALVGFVEHRPLWQVHQSVFGVLALESDPVDPRL